MPIPLGILAAAGVRPAGAAGAYDLLETVVLSSSAASVSFTNLNSTYGSTYEHLQLRIVSLSNTAYWFNLMVNSDTTSGNYRSHFLRGNGSAVDSQAFAGTSEGAQLIGHTGSSTQPASVVVDILDAFSTSKKKTIRSLTGQGTEVALTSGVYFSTSAISSLTIDQASSFLYLTGSRFSLYGLKAS